MFTKASSNDEEGRPELKFRQLVLNPLAANDNLPVVRKNTDMFEFTKKSKLENAHFDQPL